MGEGEGGRCELRIGGIVQLENGEVVEPRIEGIVQLKKRGGGGVECESRIDSMVLYN